MTPPIFLGDIVEALDLLPEGWHAFVHRPTGRAVMVSDEALAAVESGEGELLLPEERADAELLVRDPDACIDLPDRFEINEFGMMEDFCDRLESEQDRQEARRALGGRGTFRRFKETMHRLGFRDEWHLFRAARFKAVARDWCDANDIEYYETPVPGQPPGPMG